MPSAPTRLSSSRDDRGALSFAEVGVALPFAPRRFFLVHDVPAGTARGGHAHKKCDQFLVAASGRIAVICDDGETRTEHLLERPDQGLHLPAETWSEQRYLSDDACLLV